MVKKQKIKQQLKNWMIRCFVLFCFALFNCKKEKQKKDISTITKLDSESALEQKGNVMKSIGFFDYDNVKDTLIYYLKKTNEGPQFFCEMKFGSGNKKEIYIPTSSGYIQLSNCKIGCIEKSEMTTGIYSLEEIEKYIYDEKLDNWFVFETITKQGKETVLNNEFEELWSIDGETVKPN